MQRRAQEVLHFWFGPRPYTQAGVQQRARLWFGDANAPELIPQTDELIRERFGPTLLAAASGELAAWESSPRRRLALILLLDQFPRHVHRQTPLAFAQDFKALSLTVSGMQFGADATLDPAERLFFYMPLQRAEALEVQQESVAAFSRLLAESPPELRSVFQQWRESALLRRDIIERFGRFPHRNATLARENTEEERAWLAAGSRRQPV